MATHVLLHLNLLNTDDDTRAELYELLESAQWFKTHPAFTSWRCQYKSDVVDVPNVVIREIKRLAAQAGVPRLYGVAQCGNSQAFSFEYNVAQPSVRRA